MLGSKESLLDRRGCVFVVKIIITRALFVHSCYYVGCLRLCPLQLWPSTVSATIHLILAQTVLAELMICTTKSTAMWQ